jgi:hypothetical protein
LNTKTIGEFMKFQIKSVLVALSIVSSVAFPKLAHAERDGGANGGGGGLVVVNGQLKLLTEAGLQVHTSANVESLPTYYSPTPEAISQVDTIVNSFELPTHGKSAIKKAVMNIPTYSENPDRTTFIQVNSIDPDLERQIRQDYNSVAQQFGMSIPEHLLVLAAWSDRDKTYILPAFHRLTSLQQAKLLIHEAAYRRVLGNFMAENKLQKVLSVDTQIEMLLSAKQRNVGFDQLQLALSLQRVFATFYTPVAFQLIKRISAHRGSPIRLSEVAPTSVAEIQETLGHSDNRYTIVSITSAGLQFDPLAIQNLSNNDALTRTLFTNVSFEAAWGAQALPMTADQQRELQRIRSDRRKLADFVRAIRNRVVNTICSAFPEMNNSNEVYVVADTQTMFPAVVNCQQKTILFFQQTSARGNL